MRELGMSEAQAAGLSSGRRKGVNNRTGFRQRAETREKISRANVAYHAGNPNVAALKGQALRGANHYAWRGGASKLNTSIRQMTENRNWMNRIKLRDGCCVRCGSKDKLEAHHIVHLSELMERYNIKNRDDARCYAEILWDDKNGETLCEGCHYAEHGRTKREAA